MLNNMVSRIVLPVLLALMVVACSMEPRKYDFAVSLAGGPTGWPVWVEELVFDNTWRSPGGSLGGGFDHDPPGGATAILGPKPAPGTVHARWFSYRTQTFYEVTFALPDDLDDRLSQWYRDYPRQDYAHSLVVGFSGKGEALAWWSVFCNTCVWGDRSQDFSTPLVEDIVGRASGRQRLMTSVKNRAAIFSELYSGSVSQGLYI